MQRRPRIASLKKEDEEQRRVTYTYKYNANLKGKLQEAIILARNPAFLTYDITEHKIKVVPEIEEPTRKIKPQIIESSSYEPYEFADEKELALAWYIEQARSMTKVGRRYISYITDVGHLSHRGHISLKFLHLYSHFLVAHLVSTVQL